MTAYDAAVAALAAYAHDGGDQARLRDRFLAHLAAHRDGLQRACQPDHLTTGALVVNESGDRVLLNLHGKAQRWFHFGGHVEPDDDSLEAAARREVAEESGLADFVLVPGVAQLSEHVVPFCAGRPDTHHLDVRFVAVAPDDAVASASEESLDVRWFALDDLPDLEAEMLRLIGLATSVEV